MLTESKYIFLTILQFITCPMICQFNQLYSNTNHIFLCRHEVVRLHPEDHQILLMRCSSLLMSDSKMPMYGSQAFQTLTASSTSFSTPCSRWFVVRFTDCPTIKANLSRAVVMKQKTIFHLLQFNLISKDNSIRLKFSCGSVRAISNKT